MISISRQELRYYKNGLRSQYGVISKMEESQALAIYILVQTFGLEWFQKNITQSSKTEKASDPDFLPIAQRLDNGQWYEHPAHSHRMIMLADMIFNLQNVTGIDNVLNKMRTDSIEPYYAELVAGKLLRLHDVLFQYRAEGQGRGQDYDADIFLPDGRMLPCEMKCKVQTTGFSTAALDSTLSRARKQLPSDKPGVIFLEIPQWWPGGFDVIPPEQLGGLKVVQMWPAVKGQTVHGLEVDGFSTTEDVIIPSIHKLFTSSRRVSYVVVYTDARYDLETYSLAYFLHLKKMLGIEESTKIFFTVRMKTCKNPNSVSSAELPETIFEKTDPSSSWLRFMDV